MPLPLEHFFQERLGLLIPAVAEWGGMICGRPSM